MKLASGVRLGPYEIVAPIGVGGMGEVYRARDTRLDRTVAVKVLPARLASDATSELRFEREAKAIAALSHPHICSIFDVGESYLVMEFCEGQTLARRISESALPVERAVEVGIQIADALDHAHRHGIIHRDLKPSNVMLTKAGVKLLDFGLARQQFDPAPDEATMQRLTESGSIPGTVQYMAPEVLQGHQADARSDIFALGLVLYEMVTGKTAFTGASRASLVAAILERQPAFTSGAPPALEHVIRACLAKNPDDRIQTAHDVALQLRWIAADSDAAVPVEPAHRRRPLLQIVATIAALLVAAGAVMVWRASRLREPLRADRFHLQPPPGVSLALNDGHKSHAVSPDGNWVAFRAGGADFTRTGLYLRSTKSLETRLVAPVGGGPFFSPDSQWLGFVADGFLQKVPVTGGEPTRILKDAGPATWGDDGSILFARRGRLYRIRAAGGEPEQLTVPRAGELHAQPQLLPGSRHALFVVSRGMGDSNRFVAVLSVRSHEIRILFPGTSPQYVAGYVLFSRLGTLYAVKFDPDRARAVGEAKVVLDDVSCHLGTGYAAYAVSTSGALVYVPGAPRMRPRELVWIDRQGKVTVAVPGEKPYDWIAISPDGTRLAAGIFTTVEYAQLWIYTFDRGSWSRLTSDRSMRGELQWSRDGKWIFFTSFESGAGKTFRMPADGSSAAEQLTFGEGWDWPQSVSPDGTVLIFQRTQWDILTLSLRPGGTSQPFLATPSAEASPSLSPDGRWLAYESDETGTVEVHIRPFPGRDPRITVTTEGGRVPKWRRDGQELIYRSRKEFWSAAIDGGRRLRVGRPTLLFRADFLEEHPWAEPYDISPDGARILTTRAGPDEVPERRLIYAPNWIEEMKQAYALAPGHE